MGSRPPRLSLGLVTVHRRWTCSLLCPVCAGQMYWYGSIPSHPPTCQGRGASPCTFPWRDLHETQFACVVHASPAILRSNHSRRLRNSPSGSCPRDPALACPPALPTTLARPVRFRSGMVQVIFLADLGKMAESLPSGWSITAAKPTAARGLGIDLLMGVFSADAMLHQSLDSV